ncbi:MAG: hypothetical protein A3D92_10965 [Bacteroidetes bacterium RIFCSPHIGHO2_02_FULL_44_7]|nr:MAG: hypothetical protein A3D92_10965 [Bacteroidetes bacterium RIFCSPHIGHO2_02_FULL_44_7]
MDAKKLNMIMAVTKYLLGAIGVIACLLIINGPNMEDTEEVRDTFRDGGSMALAINYTLFIIIATAAIVILFFLIGLITNTKKTVIAIAGIVGALVLFLIFWAMGTSDTRATIDLKDTIVADEGTISFVTAGIYTVMVGLVIATLAALLSPFMGRYRK